MPKSTILILSFLFLSYAFSQTTFRKPGEENEEKKVIIKYEGENDVPLDVNEVKLRESESGLIIDEALEYSGTQFEFEGYEGLYDVLKGMEELYTTDVLREFWLRVNQVLSKEVGYLVYKDEHTDIRVLTELTDYTQRELIHKHKERSFVLMQKAVGIGRGDDVEEVFSEVVVFTTDIPSGMEYEKRMAFAMYPNLENSDAALDLQLYGLDNLFLSEMNEILRSFVMGALNSSNSKVENWGAEIVDILTTIGDRNRIFSRFLATSLDSEDLHLYSSLTDKLEILYGDWQKDGWSSDIEKYHFEEIPKEQWFYLLKHICTSLAQLSEDKPEFDTEQILGWIDSVSLTDPKTTMSTWNSIHDLFEIERNIDMVLNSYDNALGFLPLDNTPIFFLVPPQIKQALLDHLEKTAGLPQGNWVKGDLDELDCSFLHLTHCESKNDEAEPVPENQHVDL